MQGSIISATRDENPAFQKAVSDCSLGGRKRGKAWRVKSPCRRRNGGESRVGRLANHMTTNARSYQSADCVSGKLGSRSAEPGDKPEFMPASGSTHHRLPSSRVLEDGSQGPNLCTEGLVP